MKSRLAALGAAGVEARTFHSAALAQLHRYAPDAVGRILPTKALLLRQIANSLPPPYKFRPAGDLATEIERAKARRVPPDDYLASLDGHEPPIPANLMHTVYREYERRKAAARRDRLRGRARARDPAASRRTSRRGPTSATATAPSRSTSTRTSTCSSRRCSTCGSARATTSASSVTTTSRSTPSPARRRGGCCGVGGAVPGRDGRAARGELPLVSAGARAREPARAAARRAPRRCCARRGRSGRSRCCGRSRRRRPRTRGSSASSGGSQTAGMPLEEAAILCRTNARLADFEEVLHEAGLPFQGSSLLGRDAARRLLRLLDRDGCDRRSRSACARSRSRRAGSSSLPTSSANAS